ncbi:MAG: acetyl-CoA carboxylase biotin carboxyl carrier protein subunit [Deltaproteobacteria bacterium]|jgi:biotin carboxyl carrier protein|nr:acetyl-CoA carboxylase biotin carboxyl carrier protein subunit [Deltaproteobacteria bacterium]
MHYKIRCETENYKIVIDDQAELTQENQFEVGRDKYKFRIVTQDEKREITTVQINNKLYSVKIRKNADGSPYKVFINGRSYKIEVERIESTRFRPRAKKKKIDGNIVAVLPGQVTKILVSEKQRIKKGEPLLILEAMKMQNEIVAPCDGIIETIQIQEGQLVTKEQLLLQLKV